MVKIWLLLMLLSSPNQTTVKYNAAIYPTEEHCIAARKVYTEAFEAKTEEYKLTMKTEATCIPFESFPIKRMPSPVGA